CLRPGLQQCGVAGAAQRSPPRSGEPRGSLPPPPRGPAPPRRRSAPRYHLRSSAARAGERGPRRPRPPPPERPPTGACAATSYTHRLSDCLERSLVPTCNKQCHSESGHDLTPATLYDEAPWWERARLHERIALALEDDHRYGVAPPLASLAHHFNAALPSGSAAKTVDYATRAGEQARDRLAYEEAVDWFRVALNALAQTVPLDASRHCRLSIALASAQAKCGRATEALAALNAAANQAGALGASGDLMHAAVEFEEVAWRLGLSGAGAVTLLRKALRLSELDDDIS